MRRLKAQYGLLREVESETQWAHHQARVKAARPPLSKEMLNTEGMKMVSFSGNIKAGTTESGKIIQPGLCVRD